MKNNKNSLLKKLKSLRADIDSTDEQLLRALARRSRIVSKIGKIKSELGLPVLQKNRKRQIQNERREYGVSLGLNTAYVNQVFNLIHLESVREQKALRKYKSSAVKKVRGKK